MSKTLTQDQADQIVNGLSVVMERLLDIHEVVNLGGAEPIGYAGRLVCEALAETQQLGDELVALFDPPRSPPPRRHLSLVSSR